MTLVTPDVGPQVRTLLRAAGSEVREVTLIKWPRQPKRVIDSYNWMFSKLHLWRPGAVGRARAAFLDADAFLTSPFADHLFTRACTNTRTDLCAGVDLVANVPQGGLLVVRPSAERFQSMMAVLSWVPPVTLRSSISI